MRVCTRVCACLHARVCVCLRVYTRVCAYVCVCVLALVDAWAIYGVCVCLCVQYPRTNHQSTTTDRARSRSRTATSPKPASYCSAARSSSRNSWLAPFRCNSEPSSADSCSPAPSQTSRSCHNWTSPMSSCLFGRIYRAGWHSCRPSFRVCSARARVTSARVRGLWGGGRGAPRGEVGGLLPLLLGVKVC